MRRLVEPVLSSLRPATVELVLAGRLRVASLRRCSSAPRVGRRPSTSSADGWAAVLRRRTPAASAAPARSSCSAARRGRPFARPGASSRACHATCGADSFSTAVVRLGTSTPSSPLRRFVIAPRLYARGRLSQARFRTRSAERLLLFEVVTRRYERNKSIVLTTNKPFAEWPTVFPNAACVVTLVDRLLHRAELVAIEGDSYRLREAQERQLRRSGSRRRPKEPPLTP
ncbi:ATP-binding protein [Sorangium sp. So ce269]